MGSSMKTLALLCLILVILATTVTEANPALRNKRGLSEFSYMVPHATGRNPLDYVGYGCWCGYGGAGPCKDNIDICCYYHDNCWGSATSDTCNPYTKTYSYTLSTDKEINCDTANDACGLALCTCDRVAALCFASNTFDPSLKNYHGSDCV